MITTHIYIHLFVILRTLKICQCSIEIKSDFSFVNKCALAKYLNSDRIKDEQLNASILFRKLKPVLDHFIWSFIVCLCAI